MKKVSENSLAQKRNAKTSNRKSLKQKVFVQAYGQELSVEDMKKKALAAIKEKYNLEEVKSSTIYYKPEENRIYCVINDTDTIEIAL